MEIIRKARKEDAKEVFGLMRELAIFEKYIDNFAITEDIVIEKGFEKNPPDFYCLVAEVEQKIVGMLVYYFLPYTMHNRPAIFIKELYVDNQQRGRKLGEKLMLKVREVAKEHNCISIKWTVAPWNEKGMKFYERLGAKQNNEWINYEWEVDN